MSNQGGSGRPGLPLAALAVCGTVLGACLIAAVTAISVFGGDTDPLIRLVNTTFNAAGVLLGTAATLYAARGSKASVQAADKLNGELDDRIKESVHRALAERGAPPRRGEEITQ